MLPWGAFSGIFKMTRHSGRLTLLFPLLRLMEGHHPVCGAWPARGVRAGASWRWGLCRIRFRVCFVRAGVARSTGQVIPANDGVMLFWGTGNVGCAYLTTVIWLMASMAPAMTTYYGKHSHARVAPIGGSGSLPSSPTN